MRQETAQVTTIQPSSRHRGTGAWGRADPEKKNLLSAASKCTTLTPAIGTELHGVDLRHLSDAQKDEL